MKRAMTWMLVVMFLAGLTGCMRQLGRRPWASTGGGCSVQSPDCGPSCDVSCGAECVCDDGPGYFNPRCKCERCCMGAEASKGPATGAVAYPYYTTRGPRDFLAKNPPGVGP